ncbi:FHA domain-containing protein [Planosporangium sp. 12N6]|uniref:FHA domain-containing protein n=1 Tax=Planosporangium spinosum TaxID=3402278 RepID=UPI003CEF9B87
MSDSSADMRASNRERQRVVRALRGQLREGRLSDVTFVRRLFLALDARRRTELDRLVSDLPSRRPPRMRLAAPYARLTTRLARVFARWSAGQSRELALPPVPGTYVIGRSQDVDLHLDDISVSRHHARMAYLDGAWVIADLGSRNGTWLNGWRLPGPAMVRPGDLLDLGSCRFVVVDRRQSVPPVATEAVTEVVPVPR